VSVACQAVTRFVWWRVIECRRFGRRTKRNFVRLVVRYGRHDNLQQSTFCTRLRWAAAFVYVPPPRPRGRPRKVAVALPAPEAEISSRSSSMSSTSSTSSGSVSSASADISLEYCAERNNVSVLMSRMGFLALLKNTIHYVIIMSRFCTRRCRPGPRSETNGRGCFDK
jgi:hypothetical protein